jgi:L,D-transpeptidase catalytic domain
MNFIFTTFVIPSLIFNIIKPTIMIYRFLLATLVALSSFGVKEPKTKPDLVIASNAINKESVVSSVYNSLDANQFQIPTLQSFTKALEGFYHLKAIGKINKEFLTIVDFSLPSTSKRLWIIDTAENKIIFNSLVAHGKNSGLNYATSFSNDSESNKSSLGFFATGETYIGKHGLSLKLDGLEKGVNDKARERAIVVHGADYVSNDFIKAHNRLGLSHGCPALPMNLSSKIINTIKGKSCLFIYYPSKNDSNSNKLVS